MLNYNQPLTQLKNSGGMRLIGNKTKIDAIIKYEESFNKLYNQQVWYEGGLKDLVDGGIPVLNYKYFPKPNEKFNKETFLKDARLLKTDKNLIVELGNRASIYRLLTYAYLRFLQEGKKNVLN